MYFEIIGWFAVFCISIQFIPQVIRSYKNKDVSSLSLVTLYIVSFGGLFGSIYAFSINDLIFLTANACVFICGILLLIAKYRF